MKAKIPVIMAVIGAIVGYLILSPFAMYISHEVHMDMSYHEMGIQEVFKPGLYLWSGSFTLLGGGMGLVIGLLYHGVMERTKRIKKAKEYTDLVHDSMAEGMMAIDRDYRVVRANRALLEAVGLSMEEVVGRHCYEVSHSRGSPCEPPEETCPMKDVLETGKPTTVTHTHCDRKGNKVYVELTASPVRDEEGNIVQIIEISRDVTEQKEAEERLHQERDKTQKYLDIAGVMFVVIDANQKVSLINDRGCEILGYKEDEIVGKNWFDNFLPEVMGAEVKKVFDKLMAGEIESIEYYENPVLIKGGEERTIAWHNTILTDDGGNITGTLSSGEDITDRKEAEDGLRESKERLRLLIESAEDIIVMQDRDGRYTYYNGPPAYGLKSKDILGKTPHEFHEKPVADIIMARLKKVFETGKALNDESSIPWKGQTIYFSDSLNPVFDVDGNILGVVTISRNINERKEAERKIRKHEEFLESLMDALTHPFYVIDASNYRIVMANPAAKLDGVEESATCYALTHRRDEPCNTEEHPCTLEEVKRTKEPVTLEHIHYDRDGSPRICEVHAYPIFDEEGNVAQMIEYSLDITERKQAEEALRESEEKFRAFFENEPDYCYMVSPDGMILDVNNAVLEGLGYRKEELVGKSLKTIYAPESLPKMKENIEKWKKTGGLKDVEMVILTKDGDRRRVLLSVGAVKDRDGEIIHSVSVQRDITERKWAEEELHKAYQELKTIDETKDNIIMNVSHELRTPITIISAAIGLAMKDEDKESRNKQMELAQNALMRQDRIVGNLVEVARIKKRGFKLNIEDVNLAEVAKLAVGEVKPYAKEKGVGIEIDVSDITLQADPAEVKTVFINLLDNAVKFTGTGGRIKASTETKGGMVMVSIEDNGIGIPEEYHEKIFERLYQVDATPTRRYGGTGMGLAVVKSIIKAHGGDIWVESEGGKGARFTFVLPLTTKDKEG